MRSTVLRYHALMALLSLASVCGAARTEACTTFAIQRGIEMIFGKNYDWEIPDGVVVLNQRGVRRGGGMTLAAEGVGERPRASWIARYGSVTFNQYGAGRPHGGMNERGLVVEVAWLKETRYPAQRNTPAVGALEWIQYQLDCHASVEQILAHLNELAIASTVPVHFHCADTTGANAVVEFLGGRAVTATGSEQPVSVLTNNTYQASLAYLTNCTGFGGERVPSTTSSLDRFARTAAMVRDAPTEGGQKNLVDYAFHTLDRVSQEGLTQWSIVYDQRLRRIYFRTALQRRTKRIDLGRLSFACASSTQAMDVHQKGQGEISRRFRPLTVDAHRRLIERALRASPFLKEVTTEQIEDLAHDYTTPPCDSGN